MNRYIIEYGGECLPSIEAASESAARLIAKEIHGISTSNYLKLSVIEGCK